MFLVIGEVWDWINSLSTSKKDHRPTPTTNPTTNQQRAINQMARITFTWYSRYAPSFYLPEDRMTMLPYVLLCCHPMLL
jgi:hypothetical protein